MMQRTLWIAILPLALVLGADKAPAAKPAGKNTQSAGREGAAEGKRKVVEDRRTPFGVFKSDGKTSAVGEEKPAPPPDMTVTEDGDSLRFERRLPWGTQKWSRKKSELTDMEKAAWERSTAAKTPAGQKNRE